MRSSYTAQDVLLFTDHKGEFTLSDLATGTPANITSGNDMSNMQTGSNGNALAAHNEMGRQRQLELRVVRGSGDDKRLNSWCLAWKNRSLLFRPASASFTKTLGHEDGSRTNDTTILKFGVPAQMPLYSVNTEGDIEQVVATYLINFADNDRQM